MNDQAKTKRQLIKELRELRQEHDSLQASYDKDITGSKLAEEELRSSEERFRHISSTISDISYSCVIDQNGSFSIDWMAGAAERITGYSIDEIKAKHCWGKLVVDEDLALFNQQVTGLTPGSSGTCELRLRHKNGGIVPVTSYAECIRRQEQHGHIHLYGALVDITEKKQAEEVLRKSEEKWRALVSVLPDYVSLLDREGRFLFLNHYAEGFTEKEVIGSSIYQYFSTQSIGIFEKEIAECQNTGKMRKFEHTATGDHGIMREYEDYLVPFLEKNKATSTLVISRDITDRKRAEELSHALHDLAISLSATTSLNAALRLCLEAALHLSGMDAGGIYLVDGTSGDLDLAADEGLSPAYVASVAHYPADSANAQLVKAGQPIYARHHEMGFLLNEVKRQEGLCASAVIPVLHGMTVIACLNLASHILDETQEVARMAIETIAAQIGGTINRLRAEEELRRAEENFRRTLDDSPLGARIVTAEGETIYANRAILDIYGYDSIEELSTTPKKNRYTPESYAAFQVRYDKRRKGEETPSEYEISIVKKNNEVRHLQVFRKEVIWNGERQYQVLYIDITERKKAEKELIISKQHAEESDRLKSAFLTNMSHEIRTPMNGILGFASLLEEPDHTGEERQLYIKMIEKSGARMLNIINDIIDISKIESGLMDVVFTETNINDKIELIYNFFKPEVEKKKIQLSYKNALPLKEAIIQTDREKIFAILTNLVKNAIKFTSEGSIEFGYNLAETDNYPSLRQYQFYVKDTGIGIPKDKQEVIFERFIQSGISDKQALPGAGLGLSISKAYVEMLGGKIWVESEPGKGSTFYFTIPCNSESQKNSVIAHVASAANEVDKIRSLKILIAEDDEGSKMFISTVVKKFSHKVLFVRTGVEAIEACRNNSDLDLVLMDIRMSEMDGYEATRQIRQFNNEIIIIAQTAFALKGERERAIEAGCNDYISKPIKKEDLVALIQKYFNK